MIKQCDRSRTDESPYPSDPGCRIVTVAINCDGYVITPSSQFIGSLLMGHGFSQDKNPLRKLRSHFHCRTFNNLWSTMHNSTKQPETSYVNQNQSEAKQSGEAVEPGGPESTPLAAVPPIAVSPIAVSPVVEPPVVPKDGLAGLKENWRTDIVSGLILF